ncbi:hypothetical protein HZB88_03920 [archaeon]|nr:hypothetical protein [archaeon]
MKKEVLILIIFVLLISSVSALTPCQSGNLKASVHKDYQMLYPDEDFNRLVRNFYKLPVNPNVKCRRQE